METRNVSKRQQPN